MTTLPARVRSGLPTLARRVRRGLAGRTLEVRGVLARARAAGLEPLSVLLCEDRVGMPTSAPTVLVVHRPGRAESRAQLAQSLAAGGALALTPAEWSFFAAGPTGLRFAATGPAWGDPVDPAPGGTSRRAALAEAARMYLRELPAAGGDRVVTRTIAGRLRDDLALHGVPSRFPDVPPRSADPVDWLTASLGVFHAVFAGETLVDSGTGLEGSASPQRSTEPTRALLAPMIHDLPASFGDEMQALYLLPGPWGTRLSWQLMAVVRDDAPLHLAARLADRLRQHLAMVPVRTLGATPGSPGPVVLTVGAARGLVRRRLFDRPLRRLAVRLHRQTLVGDDVLADAVQGPDWTDGDLRAEVARLYEATAAAWRARTSAEVADLLFGAWPAVLFLARGGSPLEPLAAAHADLARGSDRALARVGAAARGLQPGEPLAVDLTPPVRLLESWGASLLRLQEATTEALGRTA